MILTLALLTLLFQGNLVVAFTNGSLLPAYLCGISGDGMPKSLGGVLPHLIYGTVNTPYDKFPAGPGTVPVQIFTGASNIGAYADSAQNIIGAIHHGNPDNYIKAIDNPIVIVPTAATNPQTGELAADFRFIPNWDYQMALVVNSPTFNNAKTALVGAFVYATDTATGLRVGEFTVYGANMQIWTACSINLAYNTLPNVGVVHNQVLSENATYIVTWRSPPVILGNIAFIGAAVSDCGFGPFRVEYNTTASATAPPLAVNANASLAMTSF